MTLLAAYDQACKALAEISSPKEAIALHQEFAHFKLYARQVADKEMLEKATIGQMRTERRLGELIIAFQNAGLVASPGRRAVKGSETPPPATLKEIGIKPKLSSSAQKAAELAADAFEEIIEATREKLRSGRAILVDPIQAAAKEADIASRRQAHAARTENGGCVADLGALALTGKRFRSIGMDPQWKFLTRSAAGEGRSANIHYKTEEVDRIKELPVGELAADDCALYMWMVDWCPQDALDLIAHYGFRHVTTAFTWVKQNPSGEGWHMGQGYWTRANPEDCWLATKGNPKRLHADVRQLIVAPVMEHSRKPDEWLERIERLTEGDYLELQARRPRKGWTSWGNELEWTGVAA